MISNLGRSSSISLAGLTTPFWKELLVNTRHNRWLARDKVTGYLFTLYIFHTQSSVEIETTRYVDSIFEYQEVFQDCK